MIDDHTDPDEANRRRAGEEERYREEVNQGGHGAHKPCEKFPIEEAREESVVARDGQMESATQVRRDHPQDAA
jgi:hypothetical protein